MDAVDTGLIAQILKVIHDASVVWAPQLVQLLKPLLVDLFLIAWVLGLMVDVFAPSVMLVPKIMQLLLGLGFSVAFMELGAEWINALFTGVTQLGYYLGAPATDPGAIIALGIQSTDSLMKNLSDQGFLSWAFSPVTWTFALAGIMLNAAFCILAFAQCSLLVSSYLLTAATPWFVVWSGVSFTRGVTLGFARLVLGTCSGLLIILLMTCTALEIGAILEQWLQQKFLTVGATPGWKDYAMPLGVGLLLCGLWGWLPWKVVREVDGLFMDYAGGRSIAGYAASTFVSVRNAAQSTWENRHGGNEKGSKESGVGGSGGGGNGGRHRGGNPYNQRPAPQQISAGQSNGGQQTTARQSAWGWSR